MWPGCVRRWRNSALRSERRGEATRAGPGGRARATSARPVRVPPGSDRCAPPGPARAHSRRRARQVVRRQQRANAPPSICTLAQRPRAASCGARRLRRRRSWPPWGCRRPPAAPHVRTRPLREVRLDQSPPVRRSVLHAPFVRHEARIVRERGVRRAPRRRGAATRDRSARRTSPRRRRSGRRRTAPPCCAACLHAPAPCPCRCQTLSGGIIHSVMHSSIEMSMRSPRPVFARLSSAARIDEYAYRPPRRCRRSRSPTFAGALRGSGHPDRHPTPPAPACRTPCDRDTARRVRSRRSRTR